MNKTKNTVRVLSAAMMFIAIVMNMSVFSYAETESVKAVKEAINEKTASPNPSSLMDSIKEWGEFINIKTEIIYSVSGEDDDRTTTIIYGTETDVPKYHIREFPTKKELHVFIKMTPYYKKNPPKHIGQWIMDWVKGKDRYAYLKDLLIPVQISINKGKKISAKHDGGISRHFVDVSPEEVNGRVVFNLNIRNDQNTILELRFIPLSQKNNKSEARLEIGYGDNNNNFVDKVVSDVDQTIIFTDQK